MKTERKPTLIGNLIPQGRRSDEVLRRNTFGLRWGVHERRGPVDHEQDQQAHQVEKNTQCDMAPLLLAFPNVPCIEIGIHEDRLRDEQGRVQNRKDHIELINKGRRELRIGGQENKDK